MSGNLMSEICFDKISDQKGSSIGFSGNDENTSSVARSLSLSLFEVECVWVTRDIFRSVLCKGEEYLSLERFTREARQNLPVARKWRLS